MSKPIDSLPICTCNWCKEHYVTWLESLGIRGTKEHRKTLYTCTNPQADNESGTEPCTVSNWKSCPLNHDIENLSNPSFM